MARTIYFLDGSREVLLTDDEEKLKLELKEILRSKLGKDTAELFEEITEPDTHAEDEASTYELACDAYRELLQDVLHGLRDLDKLVDAGRLDRKKLTSTIQRLITAINNQL